MTKKWVKETGLVLGLFFLILGFKGNMVYLYISTLLISLTIFFPSVLYPIAYVWLKLVELLSLVIPKIFFSTVFFFVIVPISFIRKILKKDDILIREWNKISTAFVDRNHKFSKLDLGTHY